MSRSRRTLQRAESRRTGRRVKEVLATLPRVHRVGGRMSDEDKAKPSKSMMGNLPSTRPQRMARRRDGDPVSRAAAKPTRATPKAVGKPATPAKPKPKPKAAQAAEPKAAPKPRAVRSGSPSLAKKKPS